MIRFTITGTNRITRQLVDITYETGRYKLTAVYSHSLEQAQTFANDYPAEHLFISLEAMAQSEAINAVYIASPSFLHFPQIELFLWHRKHITREESLVSSLVQAEATIACVCENRVVLFETFKAAYLSNFPLLQQLLPKIGKIRKAFTNYCQYSSRYQCYLDGENPSTFNPAFSNGSITDIGLYCLAPAVVLWGRPQSVQVSVSLPESSVDTHGVIVLDHGDFSVMPQHSKVSDSVLASKIQGESGSLVIEHISECQKVCFMPRGGKAQDLTTPRYTNTMLCEVEVFAHLVESGKMDHPALAVSCIIARLQAETRRQAGVVFPADETETPLTV